MCHLIGVPFGSCLIACFLQCSVNKTVFGIHYGCLAVLVSVFHHICHGLVASGKNRLRMSGSTLDELFGIVVLLQKLYGKIAC